MSDLERTLVKLVEVLGRKKIPYMVIGGLANAVWGVARATVDVDVTVWVSDGELSGSVDYLTEAFESRTPNPQEFTRKTRVLPMQSEDGIPIDVIFGLLPFEKEAISRAVNRTVQGVDVRFCTAEDLILHKVVSERPRDREDARNVAIRRKGKLDLAYLEPRLKELAEGLDRPAILSLWDSWQKNETCSH